MAGPSWTTRPSQWLPPGRVTGSEGHKGEVHDVALSHTVRGAEAKRGGVLDIAWEKQEAKAARSWCSFFSSPHLRSPFPGHGDIM